MYQVVYYYKGTVGKATELDVVEGDKFRLRRNALHYILDIIQNDYREDGWGTEPVVGGINCYKSMKTDSGDRKLMEVRIVVEKA